MNFFTCLTGTAFNPNRCAGIARRVLAGTATAVLVGCLTGQELVTSYTGAGVGAAGSQIFFDLTVIPLGGITIKSLDVNLSSPVSTPGLISFLTQAGTYTALAKTVTPGPWGLPAGVGSVVAQGVGKPSHVCLFPPVFLGPGVHAVALQYAIVAPQYTLNLPFPPAPWPTASTAHLTLSRGDYAPVPWAAPIPGPNTFDGAIHYEVGATTPCVQCASKSSIGAGCVSTCAPFLPLQLEADYPVLGEGVELLTTGASSCAVVGVTAIGFGLTCPPFGCPICMPNCGCSDYITLDALVVGVPVSGQWTFAVPIPLNNAYCGLPFFAQSFTMETPPAVLSSNALALTIGS
ncbi:MAG: hypothetical protein KDC98_23870 [Planctomycetes bacterium]|nr:hypothetical protein [Planctomycetota bacterium]